MEEGKNYTVYMHICPNDKKYIGITMDLKRRWRNGGIEYKIYNYKENNNSAFYNAIQKYGWNNIEHKILFQNLTKKEACSIEQEMIKKYNTYIHFENSNGYNMTLGGEGGNGIKRESYDDIKGGNNSNAIPINQYDLEGNFINRFPSIIDAYNFLGIKKNSGISNVAKNIGGYKQSYGYVWRYDGDSFDKYDFKRKNSTKIYKYNFFGNIVDIYDNITLAKKSVNKNGCNAISNCCNGMCEKSFGYVWRYEGDSFNKYPIPRFLTQYDTKGNIIGCWESCSQISKYFNDDNVKVRQLIYNKKQYNGFIWVWNK